MDLIIRTFWETHLCDITLTDNSELSGRQQNAIRHPYLSQVLYWHQTDVYVHRQDRFKWLNLTSWAEYTWQGRGARVDNITSIRFTLNVS